MYDRYIAFYRRVSIAVWAGYSYGNRHAFFGNFYRHSSRVQCPGNECTSLYQGFNLNTTPQPRS